MTNPINCIACQQPYSPSDDDLHIRLCKPCQQYGAYAPADEKIKLAERWSNAFTELLRTADGVFPLLSEWEMTEPVSKFKAALIEARAVYGAAIIIALTRDKKAQ